MSCSNRIHYQIRNSDIKFWDSISAVESCHSVVLKMQIKYKYILYNKAQNSSRRRLSCCKCTYFLTISSASNCILSGDNVAQSMITFPADTPAITPSFSMSNCNDNKKVHANKFEMSCTRIVLKSVEDSIKIILLWKSCLFCP
jgi:hypothetical protein